MDLDEFARTRLQSLVRFACALTGDRGLAEDIVQDVLIRLHRRAERLDEIDNLDAYARRMVVHEYATWGRKWFRIRPSADPPHPQSAVTPSDQLDDRDLLRRELGALSRRQRAVLVLRYYAGLSDAEIAAELGCRETTVRSHASRALSALRVHMTQSESEVLEALA